MNSRMWKSRIWNKRMWRAGAFAVAVLAYDAAGFAGGFVRPLRKPRAKSRCRGSRAFSTCPRTSWKRTELIEKHAAALGLPNVTTKWINLSGGGAQTDALLAGGVDILNTGTGNLLLLWDRTRGGVKGIAATSAQTMTLISRDANIKSIKDFGPNDKIAVPTVKISTQAIVLQIAAVGNVRRRPVVEVRRQHGAARPSRRLCGDDQRPA